MRARLTTCSAEVRLPSAPKSLSKSSVKANSASSCVLEEAREKEETKAPVTDGDGEAGAGDGGNEGPQGAAAAATLQILAPTDLAIWNHPPVVDEESFSPVSSRSSLPAGGDSDDDDDDDGGGNEAECQFIKRSGSRVAKSHPLRPLSLLVVSHKP